MQPLQPLGCPLTRTTRVARPQAIAVMAGQLTQGGSERQLYNFLSHCDRSRWAPVVYVSGELGIWEAPIQALGIDIVLLRGNPLTKMRQFRSAFVAQRATCFFSWSSYTNGYGLALTGLDCNRIGSFRNALFADLPTRQRWLWSWMSLAGVRTFVCNSRETERALALRIGPGKRVVYVPNALEVFSPAEVKDRRKEWRAKLGIGDETILILGVGRLAPQKRFDRFIDVVALVGRQVPVCAVVAGEDKGSLAELRAHTAPAGMESTVRFIGPVPDARELMCAADIFLLTSDYEGMPNVIMEAMAAGVACVTTPVNGVAELIQNGDTGTIATQQIEDLAQNLIGLATDAERRKNMGGRARASIEKAHRSEDVARTLWDLCEHDRQEKG